MHAKAIFYAIASLKNKEVVVKLELMIPLVGHVHELKGVLQPVEKAVVESTKGNRI